MLERLQAAGHDPYSMTLHQIVAFDRALQDRRRAEMVETMLALRAAQHASGTEFERIVSALEGSDQDEDDVVDFAKM